MRKLLVWFRVFRLMWHDQMPSLLWRYLIVLYHMKRMDLPVDPLGEAVNKGVARRGPSELRVLVEKAEAELPLLRKIRYNPELAKHVLKEKREGRLKFGDKVALKKAIKDYERWHVH